VEKATCTAEHPCYEPKGNYCTTYTCDKARPDGQCLTLTNVCPCSTVYADGSKDEGKDACCGAGCPTHRALELAAVGDYDHCMDTTLGDKCLNPKTGACDKYVCKTGTWDDCKEYTNVCACKTVYKDGSKDDGKEACCGAGCPTHRDVETELAVEKATCTADHPCYEPKGNYCTTFTCLKPIPGPGGHCETSTNVCPCGTVYEDGSKDEGKDACCGWGCPTHRALETELAVEKATCTAEHPCYEPKGNYCTTYTCDKARPDGQCLTLTNVCPCSTVYADGSKDEGKDACCGAGCPTHRAVTPGFLALTATTCEETACGSEKPCLNPANGVCFELSDDKVCPPGTQNCVCPTVCGQSTPCLQKSSGLCFPLVGNICPGGTTSCASDAPPSPVPKSDCDNICTDATKVCAHQGVCYPKVGGVCPGGTKECFCKVSCSSSTPCGSDKSDACFPLVGGQCPGGTKVCANPSLTFLI